MSLDLYVYSTARKVDLEEAFYNSLIEIVGVDFDFFRFHDVTADEHFSEAEVLCSISPRSVMVFRWKDDELLPKEIISRIRQAVSVHEFCLLLENESLIE